MRTDQRQGPRRIGRSEFGCHHHTLSQACLAGTATPEQTHHTHIRERVDLVCAVVNACSVGALPHLHDKVANYTAIIGVHAWPKGVKDTRHAHINSAFLSIRVAHCFCYSLACRKGRGGAGHARWCNCMCQWRCAPPQPAAPPPLSLPSS